MTETSQSKTPQDSSPAHVKGKEGTDPPLKTVLLAAGALRSFPNMASMVL